MITYNGKAVTQLYNNGEIDENGVSELGDLVLGKKTGRTSDDQFVFATSMGIGALDIMDRLSALSKCRENGHRHQGQAVGQAAVGIK